MPRRRRWLDGGIVVGLAALAVAAIVTGIRVGAASDAAPSVPTTGSTATQPVETARTETVADELPSIVPLPGPLREEGGILWWSTTSCRVASVDVSSGSVLEVAGEHCRTWPSPAGDMAVAVASQRSEALSGRGLVLLEARGDEESVVRHSPGILGSEIAWRPDGAAFASCFGTRDGNTVDVITPGGDMSGLADRCFPAWLSDGRLATAAGPPRSISIDGQPLAAGAGLAGLVPRPGKSERVSVSALAGGRGALAVAISTVSPTRLLPSAAAIALVSEAGEVEFAAGLPPRTFPVAVGISPDGGAVWYFDASNGRAVVLRIPGGGRFRVFDARWVSWSPSGRFLAAATDAGIVLVEWPSGRELAVLPVEARDVTWTRTP